MLDRLLRACLVIGVVSLTCAWTWPGAFPEGDPVAVLVRYHTPNVYRAVVAWYYVAPGVVVFLASQFLLSTSRIWFARMGVSLGLRSRLPTWPLSPTADGPAIVVGEVHHPVRAIESPAPEWLTIPERGLYTGVAIFGAVGSGKTSACMHPFARQLFGWHATNPERRAAALVLEVKGDFCHDIRRMLTEMGRGEDYIELSLDGRLTWNPLSATWLDAYSLAYTVASLLNQLFGKGKEPFWQQAYTNLVRWIIELHRVLPGGWVTLQDVYRCAIDKALLAQKIHQAQTYAADMSDAWVTVPVRHYLDHRELRDLGFTHHPTNEALMRARATWISVPLTEAALAHTAELRAIGFSLHATTGATWRGPDTETTRAVLTTHHLTHPEPDAEGIRRPADRGGTRPHRRVAGQRVLAPRDQRGDVARAGHGDDARGPHHPPPHTHDPDDARGPHDPQHPVRGRAARKHHGDGDPAPGRSRQPLVCPRLEHPRQQDPIEHRGRRVRVPQPVRRAGRRAGLLPAPHPRRGGARTRPNPGRPTPRATSSPAWRRSP